MISPTSNSDRVNRPDLLTVSGKPASRPAAGPSDQFSPDGTARLKIALDQQPAIRPEVVERARALAADPNYPSPGVMKEVAKQILAAPDLSETEL